MRFLRLVGLIAALTAAWFAAYIFYHRSLSDFFSQRVLELLPALYRLTRWLPDDLFNLALWLSALAALVFGLVLPAWQGMVGPPAADAPRQQARAISWRSRLGGVFMVLALVVALVNAVYLTFTQQEPLFVRLIWAGALLAYLTGCLLLDLAHKNSSRSPRAEAPSPERSWGGLVLVLLGAGLLFGWRLIETPAAVPDAVVQIGLRALAAVRGEQTHFFLGGDAPLLPLASMPTALAVWLTGDLLVGTRIAAFCTALLLVLVTWLVGCELFRRTRTVNEYEMTLEDEGQWVALLAAALVAVNLMMVHFSRQPLYLEPVAWGALGLWAGLRGVRTADPLALGLSGVLIGLAALLYPSGWLLAPLGLLWWVGVWLLQPEWLQRQRTGGRFGLIWLGALLLTTAPMWMSWLRNPDLFLARWQGSLASTLSLTTAFLSGAELGARFGSLSADLASLLLALWILAIGALLLNLDRPVGWLLLTWCGVGALGGAALTTLEEDWSYFLPLLPAVALTLAFTLDRLRAALLASAGGWLAQATTYGVVSLVLWMGLSVWIDYQQLARTHLDTPSTLGRVLRTLPTGRTPVLVLGPATSAAAAEINWFSPALNFFLNGETVKTPQIVVRPDAWPAMLPPASTLLILPEAAAVVSEAEARFPGGLLTVMRDLHANPVLYLYELP